MARNSLEQLHRSAPSVLPSLLQCDFGNLMLEVRRLEEASVAALHLDVMDGVFVPNLTYGMPIVAAIRRLTSLPLDVHLMITDPDRYITNFADAGADILTVHIETLRDPVRTAERIKRAGMGAGVALNPSTPLDSIVPHLGLWDLILVMSVPAGFGGQPFQRVALERLSVLRTEISNTTLLEVDGGIDPKTIAECARAGSHLHVVGSAIFKNSDYGQAVRELQRCASVPREND